MLRKKSFVTSRLGATYKRLAEKYISKVLVCCCLGHALFHGENAKQTVSERGEERRNRQREEEK